MKTDIVENLAQAGFGGVTSKPASTPIPFNMVGAGVQIPLAKPAKVDVTPSSERVKEAVDKMNESLRDHGFTQQIQFVIDQSSGRIVVRVIEAESQDVLRQIPSEEAIHMSNFLGQKLGQVISERA